MIKRLGFSSKKWWGLIVILLLFSAFTWHFGFRTGSGLVEGADFEVTHFTSGIVEAGTIIAVRFRRAVVPKDFVGQELRPNPFTFSPQIKGQAMWADERTLIFVPAEPLYQKRNYYAVLNLGFDLEKIEFNFRTLGQKILNLKGDFQDSRDSKPDLVSFFGKLTFSEEVSEAVLSQALRLELEGKPLGFAVESDDNRSFSFKSDQIKRTEKEQSLSLFLSGPRVGLEEDLGEKYVLASLEAPLTVLRLEEEKIADFSQLRIVFSHGLKEDKDYRGYLSIRPNIDFAAEVEGNSLVIKGNFRPREKYSVQLFPGIADNYGQKLTDPPEYLWEVAISDLNPRVEFLSSGLFLPSAGQKKIAFRTMNVARLRLQVKKVQEENLVAFYEENSYRPRSISFEDYNRYRFLRLGEVIEDRTIEIGSEQNKWIQNELDLSQVLNEQESALYIIQLDFDETQALYFSPDFNRWEISSHVYDRGTAVKHLLVSDVGITAKEMLDDLHVFLLDIVTTAPIADASILLKDGEGQVLDSASTDSTGWAKLARKSEGRYLEVHSQGQFALMSLASSLLNQSLFDIGGIQKQDGVDAFLYTERGVYRPGDELNLSLIVRNEDNTFPEDHPLTLKVYNPLDRLAYEAVANKARDGFYCFKFSTESTDPTGTWWAFLDVGGRLFHQALRIEEIVPDRIRVEIEGPQKIARGEKQVDFKLRSEYLFQAPAGGLETETTIYLEPYAVSFPAYSKFVFDNEAIDFAPFADYFDLSLDHQGEARLSWQLPQFGTVPSGLRLRIISRVLESGGRAVTQSKNIPLEHYPSYVGILELENSELGLGAVPNFSVVHLSREGEALAESDLEYNIYSLRRYWWWEYGNETSFRRHYKSNEELVLEASGTLRTAQDGLAQLAYELDDYGEILLEVRDPLGGHSAGYFFRSYWWGDGAEDSSPAALTLKLDREQYLPGDIARVSLSAPVGARALLTVEKEGELLEQSWREITEPETVFGLEVKEEHIPNAYISLFIYQPYARLENDLPLRLYGLVPLMVASEGTRLELDLDLPETIRPEEEFTLGIQTTDGRPAQFTVAVVDEGILNITAFKTPDPWGHFFSKQRLLTRNYDNFSDIIDPSYGYVHNLFTVGGGLEEDYREMQVPDQSQRFEAVSIFMGPLETDQNGWAQVELKLPNYIGSVKVMVVAAREGHYGQASQSVPVKAPLMVLPTLPRVLRPGDRIRVPVTVFALEEELGDVSVCLDLAGPVQMMGPQEFVLHFEEAETQEVFFELTAEQEIGRAEITISAVALGQDYRGENRVVLPIRAANPHIYLSTEQIAKPGQSVDFLIPPSALSQTESVRISVSPFKGLNINHRLRWLLRYPYCCLEQVTSGVFPQLYLPDVFDFEQEQLEEMDDNINATLRLFNQYQLNSGGFSYWPGGGAPELWTTNYAGHFLLEAQQKGYHLPSNLLASWLQFQTKAARENQGEHYTRAYRLYLLALAGQPVLSAMNYMRESELDQLENPEKHLLAAAYWLSGYDQVGAEILQESDLEVKENQQFRRTFGSLLRDQAVLLDVLVTMGQYERGVSLYYDLAQALSSNKWYSTQTTAYSLLALSKYVAAVSQGLAPLEGELLVRGQASVNLKEESIVAVLPLVVEGEETVTFRNTASVPLFVTLEWEGIPKTEDLKPEQNNLTLSVDYFDEKGTRLDITRIPQGTSFYGVFQVGQMGFENLTELALVQVLPAGWEIENLRLSGGELPSWAEKYNLERENYLDLRDDRLMWFFDLYGWVECLDFIVKLNAVTVGEFYLPPTLLEAMYDNDYKVVTEGRFIEVESR